MKEISTYIGAPRMTVNGNRGWWQSKDTFGENAWLPYHEAVINGIKRQNEDNVYKNIIIFYPNMNELLIADERHMDNSAKCIFHCKSFKEAEFFISRIKEIDIF